MAKKSKSRRAPSSRGLGATGTAPLSVMRKLFPNNSDAVLRREWGVQPASHWCSWASDEKERLDETRDPEIRALRETRVAAISIMCRKARGR